MHNALATLVGRHNVHEVFVSTELKSVSKRPSLFIGNVGILHYIWSFTSKLTVKMKGLEDERRRALTAHPSYYYHAHVAKCKKNTHITKTYRELRAGPEHLESQLEHLERTKFWKRFYLVFTWKEG